MAIETAVPVQAEGSRKGKYLLVKVVDTTRDGRPAVNIKMPIGFVKWGMKVAQSFSPELKQTRIDWDSVAAALESGELDELVEVEDETDHKTVELWIE